MTELLSPAGGWEAMVAAVQNGADAVYMGFGGLNARRSARNFTDEEFRAAVAYCHLRVVKVYLTLNTLVTDRELPAAAQALQKASDMGVDAILIQDWGVWRLAREIAPDVPLHASTQMSLHTLGGACRAAELGLERVVLARELSRRDIHTITRGCPAEIEVFGHGALCMCYSGQCEMSAVIGGRSGNRGACAQPCRLPYGVNEKASGGHPLSLKDANLSAYLQELDDMGVACLKLEGRMKRPEYVAVITGIYRRLLDEKRAPTQEESRQLEAAFSRSGFTDGYYRGRTGPEMFGTRPENAPEPKELFARAKAAYEKEDRRRIPVTMSCTLGAGVPAQLTASAKGHTVRAEGPVPEAARNRALTAEDLRIRLEKTGGTVFEPKETQVELADGLMLPASAVNAMRRQVLEELAANRTPLSPAPGPAGAGDAAADLLRHPGGAADGGAGPVRDGVCPGRAAGRHGPGPLGGHDPDLRGASPDLPDRGRGASAAAFAAAPGTPVRRGHRQSGTPAHCRWAGPSPMGGSGAEYFQQRGPAVLAGAGSFRRCGVHGAAVAADPGSAEGSALRGGGIRPPAADDYGKLRHPQ